MERPAFLSAIFQHKGQIAQVLSGVFGLLGLAYGLQVLMVERAQIPACSAEMLLVAGENSFLEEQKITVEIAGAVIEPGVWQLPIGARWADGVEKAGGFSQRADRAFVIKSLNLAESLKDGQKIYIPFEGEFTSSATQSSSDTSTEPSSQSVGSSAMISINNASAKELQSLPGIGEARSASIIEGRPYGAIDDLLERGILIKNIFDSIHSQLSL